MFHSLIVFILLHIEGLEVVPILSQCELESLQTVHDCAVVVALAFRGISEGGCAILVVFELLDGFLSTHFENDNHECAHEEHAIDELVLFFGAIVEDFVAFIGGVLVVRGREYLEKASEFARVPVHHG